MMMTLEQVIAAAQMLPREDRRSLQRFLLEQERRDVTATQTAVETIAPQDNGARPVAATPLRRETVEQQIERYRRAKRWIREHRAEYLGQWVVLDGDRLISHGSNSQTVFEQARAAGIEPPFLEQIREEEKGPFMGGWL